MSAILRLFLAIRMLRRLTAKPKPFSNCWLTTRYSDDCTAGLKEFTGELEELRVLSQATVTLAPEVKPCDTLKLYWAVWLCRPVSAEVPVPEINGLLIGMRSEEHTSELQSHLNLVCR